MSTYIGIGCKGCQVVSETFNHDDTNAAALLVLLPEIRVLIDHANALNATIAVRFGEYSHDDRVSFALEEHAGHDLWIVDEYGYAGKTLEGYRANYGNKAPTFWKAANGE